MHEAIEKMLSQYQVATVAQQENALKEIIQEVALLGLWRSKFFEHAAFYGGTALRLFFGLDRFSEDLDFSLLKPNAEFDLGTYCNAIRNELESYGLKTDVVKKEKRLHGAVQSAFIKTGTSEYDLKIRLNPKKKLSIKLEVDTDPPGIFTTQARYLLNPTDFYVNVFSKQDLFAGKMHAILCRQWKNRVKGRDWYDLVWFCRQKMPLHLEHLQERMVQSGHWDTGKQLTNVKMKNLLETKIKALDVEKAKSDIRPFIKDPADLEIWSTDFFLSLLDAINQA